MRVPKKEMDVAAWRQGGMGNLSRGVVPRHLLM